MAGLVEDEREEEEEEEDEVEEVGRATRQLVGSVTWYAHCDFHITYIFYYVSCFVS